MLERNDQEKIRISIERQAPDLEKRGVNLRKELVTPSEQNQTLKIIYMCDSRSDEITLK